MASHSQNHSGISIWGLKRKYYSLPLNMIVCRNLDKKEGRPLNWNWPPKSPKSTKKVFWKVGTKFFSNLVFALIEKGRPLNWNKPLNHQNPPKSTKDLFNDPPRRIRIKLWKIDMPVMISEKAQILYCYAIYPICVYSIQHIHWSIESLVCLQNLLSGMFLGIIVSLGDLKLF